jgi:hypothetical protein
LPVEDVEVGVEGVGHGGPTIVADLRIAGFWRG